MKENYKDLEFIGYQLSKITGNSRYQFSKQYYDIKKETGSFIAMKRGYIFEDGNKYISIILDYELGDYLYYFTFENKNDFDNAIKFLQEKDTNCNFDDYTEEALAISKKNGCDLLIYAFDAFAHHLGNTDQFSFFELGALMEGIIQVKIEPVNEGDQKSYQMSFQIDKMGIHNIEATSDICEIKSMDDIEAFNVGFFHFVNNIQSLENYKLIDFKLKDGQIK